MSFSKTVKEEILSCSLRARHCILAELSAFINICASLDTRDVVLHIHSENEAVLKRIGADIESAFNFKVKYGKNNISIVDKNNIYALLKATGADPVKKEGTEGSDAFVLKLDCCKRAYIAAAFLCCGSVSDPEKNYHLEFVLPSEKKANFLKKQLEYFEIKAGITKRKNHSILYIKEGEMIVDTLNVISAHKALLSMENSRVVKEMRNNVNRIVNCETANINKIVSAAVRQLEAISYIEEKIGLDSLDKNLSETAKLRKLYPDLGLKELGGLFSKPIGKSGVNHRLKKICDIADGLKGEKQW
ncbi:MAG: DNA-binding protein WhiA [Firmicutes bacterium]|nr:DNA-binding protein WhiA [Bacillota bacterium]